MQTFLNASLEAVLYEPFYRVRGIRKYTALSHPLFSADEAFTIPTKSIVHYLPRNSFELGIDINHLFLRKAPSVILAQPVDTLTSKLGSPTPTGKAATIQTKYRNSNRKIRPMKLIEAGLRDKNTVMVFNYPILNHAYRYKNTQLVRYHKFINILSTLVSKINELGRQTDRQQYIEIHMPTVLPTKQQFIVASDRMNLSVLKSFPNDDSLMLSQIWSWLSLHRERSVLSSLDDDVLDKVNLVVMESGKWVMFNLGKLNEWRMDPNDPESVGVQPAQMQLSFLKFLESVVNVRSIANSGAVVIPDNDLDNDEDDIPDTDEEQEQKELEELRDLEENSSNIDETEIANAQSDTEETMSLDKPNRIKPVPISDEKPIDLSDVHIPQLVVNIDRKSSHLLDQGMISVNEKNRYDRLGTSYERIPNPFGEGSLEDAMKISDEDLVLKEEEFVDRPYIFDKSMLKSTLSNYTPQYVEKVLNADVVNAVMAAQNNSVAVTGYRVEKVRDVNNEFDVHYVQFTPVGGAPSTFSFTLPAVRKDGTFLAAGTKYRYRTQRGDLPIVKVNPSKVGLTSYYGKIFVNRSTKVVDDYGSWLMRSINIRINEPNSNVKADKFGNVFDPTLDCPRAYSTLAKRFTKLSVTVPDLGLVKIDLDQSILKEQFGEDTLAKHNQNGEVVCGSIGKKIVVMSMGGNLYDPSSGNVYGSIEDILTLDSKKAPSEIATVNIMGKAIPVAVVLGYHYGLVRLLNFLGADYRQVQAGARLDLQPDEYVLRFSDQSVVLSKQQPMVSLIVGSLRVFKNTTKLYSLEEFEDKQVYGAVLEREGLGVRYAREIESLYDMFIDPITKDILQDMKEPDTFGPLVVRACELLLNDKHDKEGSKLRQKGYERLSGAVYSEIVKGLRKYNAKTTTAKTKIDINPNSVWMNIQKDPSVCIVEESNPNHELKESESTTFTGVGGRSARTMVKRSRAFGETDIGIISEATVDSGDVGITCGMTANPQMKNLRGIPKGFDGDYSNISSLVSTTMLMSPSSERDDGKRTNFTNIQLSHQVAADGYSTYPLMTGYEDVIAHRTSTLFSYAAKDEGTVTSLDKKHIGVTYKDGSEVRIKIGVVYGSKPGYTVPHNLMTDLSKGHVFKKGDVLCWNSGFFTRSILDPTQVTWMAGVPIRVVFIDDADTIEDSCAISERCAAEAVMDKVHKAEISLTSDQGIHNLVEVGEKIASDSILCNIEDSLTSGSGMFDDHTAEQLNMMGRSSPKAGGDGVVQRIEVIYNADYEDLSPSLLDVVRKYDEIREKEEKNLKSNKPTVGFASDLPLDSVIIRVYIAGKAGAADGDKVVLSHQLKSVVARVMVGKNETESGVPIDMKFGYKPVSKRIVNSPVLNGTTATLIKVANKRCVKAYRS